MDSLVYRCVKAYRRRCAETGQVAEPIGERSDVADARGRKYIILRNDAGGIIEVFGIREHKLYRISRTNWPAGID